MYLRKDGHIHSQFDALDAKYGERAQQPMKSVYRRVDRMGQRFAVVPSAQELRTREVADTLRRVRAPRLGQPYVPLTT